MNTPLQFPIDDKTIYQMGLNPGTSAGTYVAESNAVLTNQILEILNPTSNEIDKTRIFTDLMTPHYQKQDEIVDKIDKLATIVTSFIETQKSINEFIFERLLKTVNSTTSEIGILQNGQCQEFTQSKHISFDFTPMPSEITQEQEHRNEEATSHAVQSTSNNPENVQETKMSVRDFLKTNPPSMKRDSEQSCDEDNDEDMLIDETIKKYNKFRVRNPPKKYKRNNGVTLISTETKNNKVREKSIEPTNESTSHPHQHHQPIVMPSAQRIEPRIDLNLMQPNIYSQPSSFLVQNLDSHTNPLVPNADLKFHQNNPDSCWKPLDPSPPTSSFLDHQVSNFVPFMSSEPHSRSAFVPAYHKERR